MTPADELLGLDFLQIDKIENSLHAYQPAKRANEKRTMYEAVEWGKKGARINDIAPGIVVTPLAVDELSGIRGDFL
ncbi:Short-chain dehydrogenase/oxidoreductase [Streptococcus sp. DD11]|nr:Short-chain dehydrogenase/oxidoreductase [Streptococcus sp. DD11]